MAVATSSKTPDPQVGEQGCSSGASQSTEPGIFSWTWLLDMCVAHQPTLTGQLSCRV